jgi:hypothetical protein
MKISTKQYVDNQVAWQKKVNKERNEHNIAEFKSIRRAVDKYSDTNDEWKTLHNGLQRQLLDQQKGFVTQAQFKDFVRMVWAVVVLLVTLIAMAYFSAKK